MGDDSDFEEVCPEGCDKGMYEKVLELREVRLDQEEQMDSTKALKKKLEAKNKNLAMKEQTYTRMLKEVESEINAFQIEKQKGFNEIEMWVLSRLSQFNCL